MRDGCYLADKAQGIKSSCSECPFSDCVLGERQSAVYEGLHGIELEQSRMSEVSEVDLRKMIMKKFDEGFELDAFRHRWLKDVDRCNERAVVEKDRMLRGYSVVCCECGWRLNKYDTIYWRKGSVRRRYWCELCVVKEVLALLYLRRCLGVRMINLGRYERLWKAVVSAT